MDMNKAISILLAVFMLLALMTGCAASGKQASAVAENEGGEALTVRIANRSGTDAFDVAASYYANGILLGSRSCVRVGGGDAKAEAYEFVFPAEELPVESLASFRIDIFAAENAGEDYIACGSAEIQAPKIGGVYTLALNGDFASGLYLSADETASDQAVHGVFNALGAFSNESGQTMGYEFAVSAVITAVSVLYAIYL